MKPPTHKMSAATEASPWNPVSILYKSIAGRYRPVRVADGGPSG